MRVFLMSVILTLLIAIGADLVLRPFTENAADAFAVRGSVRLSPGYGPDPGGKLAHEDSQAAGLLGKTDASGGNAPAPAR